VLQSVNLPDIYNKNKYQRRNLLLYHCLLDSGLQKFNVSRQFYPNSSRGAVCAGGFAQVETANRKKENLIAAECNRTFKIPLLLKNPNLLAESRASPMTGTATTHCRFAVAKLGQLGSGRQARSRIGKGKLERASAARPNPWEKGEQLQHSNAPGPDL
jgi:hypothetical protein